MSIDYTIKIIGGARDYGEYDMEWYVLVGTVTLKGDTYDLDARYATTEYEGGWTIKLSLDGVDQFRSDKETYASKVFEDGEVLGEELDALLCEVWDAEAKARERAFEMLTMKNVHASVA